MNKLCKIWKLIRQGTLRFALSKKFANKNLILNLKLIDRRVNSFIKGLKNNSDLKGPIPDNIFFFWYDGLDKMPKIPTVCLRKLKENYGDKYNIVFVDKNNMESLSSINPFFIDLLNKKKISIQMFSDILRFTLLHNIGGYWVDSSLFFYSNKFDFKSLLNDLDFNSVENISINKPFISYDGNNSKWCSFLLAGKKGNIESKSYLETIKYYFSKYKHAPYFMTDILITLLVKYGVIKEYNKFGQVKINAYSLTDNENKTIDQLDSETISKIMNSPQKLINSTDLSAKNKDGIFYKLVIENQSLNPFLK